MYIVKEGFSTLKQIKGSPRTQCSGARQNWGKVDSNGKSLWGWGEGEAVTSVL